MKITRAKPERVGIVYYWKQDNGAWALQMVHNTRYATLDCSKSESEVKKIAEAMGYTAVKHNG